MSLIRKNPIAGWRLHYKIALLAMIGVSMMLLAIFVYYIPYIESRMLEERRTSVRNAVELAHGIAAHFHNEVAEGDLERSTAQQYAMETIKDLRYPPNGYIWIHNSSLRMIMHPTITELDGNNLKGFTDATGFALFERMVELTDSQASGYVSYMWPKPGEGKPSPKLSYVKKFEPWEWVLGSGVYIDHVERDMNDLILISIGGAILISIVLIIAAYGTGINISRRLSLIRDGLHQIASDRGDIDLTRRISIINNDEIDSLSQEFNQLIEQIHNLKQVRLKIDELQSAEEIYEYLADFFTKEMGISNFRFYEVDEYNEQMCVVLERGSVPEERHCKNIPIIQSWNSQKIGIKPGESKRQTNIYGQYQSTDSYEYINIPLVSAGSTFGVIQFVIDKALDFTEKDKIFDAIGRGRRYIKEAIPVLDARRLTAKLRFSALSDPLTGLHNRRFLEECQERLCAGVDRRHKVLGILMCDLDYFKQINDEYGHDAGDQALVEVATLLSRTVRKMDMVIRMGGEEFLIVLKDVEAGMPLTVAEKIRQKVAKQELKLAGMVSVNLTVSIGVAEYPVDNSDFELVIKYADLAAYHAKHAGRNQCLRYSSDMAAMPVGSVQGGEEVN